MNLRNDINQLKLLSSYRVVKESPKIEQAFKERIEELRKEIKKIKKKTV